MKPKTWERQAKAELKKAVNTLESLKQYLDKGEWDCSHEWPDYAENVLLEITAFLANSSRP
jgi:hypothetical protein